MGSFSISNLLDMQEARESDGNLGEDYNAGYDGNSNQSDDGKTRFSISSHTLLKVKVTIQGQQVTIFLDDGGGHDFIALSFAKKLSISSTSFSYKVK